MTTEGPANITSEQEFNTLGSYTVTGPGASIAQEWIENAWGAFGHRVGSNAAPCDLHSAAMDLQSEPEDKIRFMGVEGDIQTYDSRVPTGSRP